MNFFYCSGGYRLQFPGLAEFEVAVDGSSIRQHPAPGTDEATLRHLYQNQVWPLAMGLRGKLAFHAGAVELGDDAVAFLAESGRGKSTLTAAFASVGFRFLTDDGLIVEEAEDDGYRVLPSHPSIRLWDDSREALAAEDAVLDEPVQYTSKARILADRRLAFCGQPRLLKRMYFLGDGTAQTPTIQPMAAAEALIELVKHSFLLDVEARDIIARHFDRLSRLVAQTMCFRLDYPRRYDALDEVRRAIIEHARNPITPIS